MVYPCTFGYNIIFKMSVLCFVFIIAIKMRQWCLECILNFEDVAQTIGFPAVQGFTTEEITDAKAKDTIVKDKSPKLTYF